MLEKHEKMILVAEHVLKILLTKGMSGLSFAQVAQSAGVSRPWLYKYMGRTREDLIQFAAAHFGRILVQLDVPLSCKTREEFIQHSLDSLRGAMRVTLAHPWMLPVYYRFVGTRTPIGAVIQEIESAFLAKVTREVETFLQPRRLPPKVTAQALTSLNLGVCHRWLQVHETEPDYPDQMLQVVRAFLESVH